MREITLLLVEASGIQDYIFGSNNLAQNIGASELVTCATGQWVVEALDELKLPHNVSWDEKRGNLKVEEQSITRPGVGAEVIYAGGGNALILFAGSALAQAAAFTRIITTRAVREARGLALDVGTVEFDWDAVPLSAKLEALRGELARRKLNRPADASLLGLAVTAACDFSGLPAVAADPLEGHLISQVVACKLAAADRGKERLHAILPQVRQAGFQFVYDFDKFGEKGESSYIAVVHTDGNGMGKRFKALAEQYAQAKDNPDYVKALRNFSGAVNARAEAALNAAVNMLLASWDARTALFGEVVPAPEIDREYYLPFRPIVFGGDDVTFICEGRLGLALAARYLQVYADETQLLTDQKPAYARAGVSVVKAHYPFSRAYALAEELCKSAKAGIERLKLPGKEDATVIDWHFSTSGVVLELAELRQREYVAETSKSLLMRPVYLDPMPGQKRASKYWRSWHNFTRITRAFQEDEQWAGRHNKVKALRDALRAGPAGVERFLRNYALQELPAIPEQPDMAEKGWQGDECGYFDAVEATDFYVPLERKEAAQ